MAEEEKQPKEATTEELIKAFKIEPTISIDPSLNANESESQSMIPTSNRNAVQFSQRPMYSSSYNPMHERRKKAIKAIYQFLEEENLDQTLNKLQEETRIPYDNGSIKEFGVLLEAMDLRSAYYSAQSKSSNNSDHYMELLKSKTKLDEKPCINLLYSFHGIHKSNILCVDVFYYNNITYIISGVATRSLMILSCKNIFNLKSVKPEKYNLEEMDSKECNSRIISEMNGLSGPPLYIDIDPKYKQYAIITCMDGSIYIIDLHSTILTPNNWKFIKLRDHKKYVIIGRWSHSSQYLLTAGHDNKSTLYRFERKENTFNVHKIHQYEFEGSVEGITFISNNEFIISVRNSNYLEYYRIDDDETDDNNSYFIPYLKCNVNAFGDNHISFNIADIQISNDKNFILLKTDHEKVLLMINKTEETLKTYYGSHSDLYTYSRCCFSKNEKYIYSSHHNHFVIWDIQSMKIIYKQTNAHKKTLRDLCIDKKHGVIITASFDRTIKIWAP